MERSRSWPGKLSPKRFGACDLAAVVLAGIGIAAYRAGGFPGIHRPLRIGFQNSPPYRFPDASRRPTGPAVELLQLAAQRAGIRLQWVFSPKGPEELLTSGWVDLWPVIADLPGRRGMVYISKPWARLSYVQLTPEGRRAGHAISTLVVSAHINSDAPNRPPVFSAGQPAARAYRDGRRACRMQRNRRRHLVSINGMNSSPRVSCTENRPQVVPIEGAIYWLGVGCRWGVGGRARRPIVCAGDRRVGRGRRAAIPGLSLELAGRQ